MILVLWDIDRTLIYTGDTDRKVYRELFKQTVGRLPRKLPARGTGVTMPLAVRELLRVNEVEPEQVELFAEQIIQRMPERLGRHRDEIRRTGRTMPGAPRTLAAVHRDPDLVPTVVTGNLQGSAEVKLQTLGLADYLDLTLGGYASDDSHRPSLVRVAQRRAGKRLGRVFSRETTVILGDSLEDVRTGREGGAQVIGIASGVHSKEVLASAGAHHVIPDLLDTQRVLQLIHDPTHGS